MFLCRYLRQIMRKPVLCHMGTTKAQISLHNYRLYLASIAEQASLSLAWSQTSKEVFLCCGSFNVNSINPHQTTYLIAEPILMSTHNLHFYGQIWKISLNYHQIPILSVSLYNLLRKIVQTEITHWAHCEDWSVRADAQADLSLCCAHMSFCWFCPASAHLICRIEGSTRL